MPQLRTRFKVRSAVAAALSGVLLLSGCGGLLSKEDDGTAKNWAVIVGVSNYREAALDLKWADEDALDMYDFLHSGKSWDADNLTLLTGSSATRDAIKSAVAALAKRVSADDKVVFYFSGRGSYGPDQTPFDEADGLDEYLLPYDARIDSPVSDLSDDELEKLFSALPTSNVLIILDTGFAGSQSKVGIPSDKEKCLIRSSNGGFVAPRSVDGMVRDLARPGYVYISAAQNGVAPGESSQLRNGVFTYYFIEGLRGAAEAGQKTTAQQAFEYASPRTATFGGGQAPQLIDNVGRNFAISTQR